MPHPIPPHHREPRRPAGGPAGSESLADRLMELCLQELEALATADLARLAGLAVEKRRILEELRRLSPGRPLLVRLRRRNRALLDAMRPALALMGVPDPQGVYRP